MKYKFNGVELKIGQAWVGPDGTECTVSRITSEGIAQVVMTKVSENCPHALGYPCRLMNPSFKLKTESLTKEEPMKTETKAQTIKKYIQLGTGDGYHHVEDVQSSEITVERAFYQGGAGEWKPCGVIEIEVDSSTGQLVSANAKGKHKTEVEDPFVFQYKMQANSWMKVWDTLESIKEDFWLTTGSGEDVAVNFIKELAEKAKKYDDLKSQVKQLLN